MCLIQSLDALSCNEHLEDNLGKYIGEASVLSSNNPPHSFWPILAALGDKPAKKRGSILNQAFSTYLCTNYMRTIQNWPRNIPHRKYMSHVCH